MSFAYLNDQTGHHLELHSRPERIVSVVPSQTELLFDLGLGSRIKGVTKFCVHPLKRCREKIQVGGTKKLHLDRIRKINPDLILANREENTRDQIEALKEELPVYVSDVKDFNSAFEMIKDVGKMTGTREDSDTMVAEIKKGLSGIRGLLPSGTFAYFIWRGPAMVAGNDTFIHSVLEFAGLTNAVAEPRYPEWKSATRKDSQPDWVLLSSEPFPFSEKHGPEFREKFPRSSILYVDGEMLSWYGSRLLKLSEYLMKLKPRFEKSD